MGKLIFDMVRSLGVKYIYGLKSIVFRKFGELKIIFFFKVRIFKSVFFIVEGGCILKFYMFEINFLFSFLLSFGYKKLKFGWFS